MEMDGEEVCTLEILLRSLTSHDYSDVMTAALGQIQDHIRLHVLLNNFMFNHQGTSGVCKKCSVTMGWVQKSQRQMSLKSCHQPEVTRNQS